MKLKLFRAFSTLLLVTAGMPVVGFAAIPWAQSIDQAKQTAAQTNRLVLLHFWSTTCQPCLKLEQTVYSQPGVDQQIASGYVPVKIDANQFPALAQQFDVKSIPTDVVLTPDGQVVAQRISPLELAPYTDGLNQLVAAYRANTGGSNVTNGPSAAPVGPYYAGQPAGAQVPVNSYAPPMGPGQAAMQPNSVNAPTVAGYPPANQAQPPYSPARSGPPSQNIAPGPNTGPAAAQPPLALDGHCPVELVEREQWQPGDKRWGAFHRGKLYLFAGPEQQQKFLQNPDYYSPAMSGNDPVIAVEQQRLVQGHRQHGLFCDSRIYLFSSEETLNQFSRDPLRYVQGIRQAEATGRLLR